MLKKKEEKAASLNSVFVDCFAHLNAFGAFQISETLCKIRPLRISILVFTGKNKLERSRRCNYGTD
jgi:hypothetical protein